MVAVFLKSSSGTGQNRPHEAPLTFPPAGWTKPQPGVNWHWGGEPRTVRDQQDDYQISRGYYGKWTLTLTLEGAVMALAWSLMVVPSGGIGGLPWLDAMSRHSKVAPRAAFSCIYKPPPPHKSSESLLE